MLDLNKPMQTRDGWPARFVTKLDGVKKYPYVFAWRDPEDNTEYLIQVTEEGRALTTYETDNDIINVPEKRYVWLNVYPDAVYLHITEDIAKLKAYRNIITTLKIEVPTQKD